MQKHKPIIYIAHPVSAGLTPKENALNTLQWVKWFVDNDPRRIYIAPWVAEVQAFLDVKVSPEFYQRVLDDDCDVVLRMDGIVGVGGQWTRGMLQERATARAANRDILDMTRFLRPSDVPAYFDIELEWGSY